MCTVPSGREHEGSGPRSQAPVTISVEMHQDISYQSSYSNGFSTREVGLAGRGNGRSFFMCPQGEAIFPSKSGTGVHRKRTPLLLYGSPRILPCLVLAWMLIFVENVRPS